MSEKQTDTPAQTVCKLRDDMGAKIAGLVADFESKSGMRVTGINIVTVDSKKAVTLTLSLE